MLQALQLFKSYPLPGFYFQVTMGLEMWSFQEVSGLNTEVEVLNYRHGKSKQLGNYKMPGRPSTTDAVLKKGMFRGDTFLFEWFQGNLTELVRKDVTICLLNEYHIPEIIWILSNAFPVKIESSTLNSTDSAVAVESVTLSYDELQIENSISMVGKALGKAIL